jgi:hypothetical protein
LAGNLPGPNCAYRARPTLQGGNGGVVLAPCRAAGALRDAGAAQGVGRRLATAAPRPRLCGACAAHAAAGLRCPHGPPCRHSRYESQRNFHVADQVVLLVACFQHRLQRARRRAWGAVGCQSMRHGCIGCTAAPPPRSPRGPPSAEIKARLPLTSAAVLSSLCLTAFVSYRLIFSGFSSTGSFGGLAGSTPRVMLLVRPGGANGGIGNGFWLRSGRQGAGGGRRNSSKD